MMRRTDEIWKGGFGDDYVSRNPFTADEMNELSIKNYGETKKKIYEMAIDNCRHVDNVLQVGCSIGLCLGLMKGIGLDNLYGVDINRKSLNIGKRQDDVFIIEGNCLDLPFKDRFFDLVFTDGLLIHIHPDMLKQAMSEIYRVSRKYIMGFEYYSSSFKSLKYRGLDNLLWKGDFCNMYANLFVGLKIIYRKKYEYVIGNGNKDEIFLLQNYAFSPSYD